MDGPYDILWLASLTLLAWAAVELRADVPAQQLYEMLVPYHDQLAWLGTGGGPPVACYLGGLASVLGRYDEAENYFIEATDLNTRGGLEFAAAWTRLPKTPLAYSLGRGFCYRTTARGSVESAFSELLTTPQHRPAVPMSRD